MRMRKRIERLEAMVEVDDPIESPVSMIEALHGIRDEATRRHLGPEGCRRAAKAFRDLLAELAD